MLTTPTQSLAEEKANAVFDALLWALSRPGLLHNLSEQGEAQIMEALIDRECRAFCSDSAMMTTTLQTGAEITPLEVADYAFLGEVHDASALRDVAQGSDLYPDAGATIVIRADLSNGQALRLTGPGVDGDVLINVGGLPSGFWETRADVMRYPMGFEMFLIDEDQIIGVPRSTIVVVL